MPPPSPSSATALDDSQLCVFTLTQTTGDKEGYPILIRRCPEQGATFMHEHVYHEVVFVESGTAEHLSAEGKRRLVVGDVIVIKPRIWHRYTNTQGFGIINCLFDRRILVHQKVFLSLASGAFELFQKPVRKPKETPPTFLHASSAQQERLLSILNTMIRERHEKQIDWQGALVGSLLNLIVAISRIYHGAHRGPNTAPNDQRHDLANAIMVYLEEHFRSRISLEELSKRFHASHSHLSRVFAQRLGMGIVDYINHLRIEAACELLKNTDWPASRIASEVGYDEVPYFFRRFKREMSASPQEYRKGIVPHQHQ